MSELNLKLTEKFTDEDVTAIRVVLSRHFQVSDPTRLVWRSFDPPSLIELLAAAATWRVLLEPAAAFLKGFFGTLGTRAANAALNSAPESKDSKDLEALTDVAEALVSAADRVGGKVTISFGLNIPNSDFGTVVETVSRDPSEVARILATFVVHAEQIAEGVQAELERGHKPSGEVFIELPPDGTVKIRWFAGRDLKTYEKRIS